MIKIFSVNLFLLAMLINFSSCFSFSKFIDGGAETITERRFLQDSLVIVEPTIIGTFFPGDYSEMSVIDLGTRPDNIRKGLEHSLKEKLHLKQRFIGNEVECRNFIKDSTSIFRFSEQSLQQGFRRLDSITVFNCLNTNSKDHKLFFVFRLHLMENGYSSPTIWDNIVASYTIVQGNEIKQYRLFRSKMMSSRANFPKGSEDRKNFPHFPQRQIEKVVDALVEDLKKRVY